MDDTGKILLAQLASTLIISVAVVASAQHVAGVLRQPAAGSSSPSASASFPMPAPSPTVGSALGAAADPSRSPVSPKVFLKQWEGHYADKAAEKCWLPNAKPYEALPGHLDLKLKVSKDGQVADIELTGYRNPGDKPDEQLTKKVFACVSQIIEAARFPKHPTDYVIEGRVNRANPPPSVGKSPTVPMDPVTGLPVRPASGAPVPSSR